MFPALPFSRRAGRALSRDLFTGRSWALLTLLSDVAMLTVAVLVAFSLEPRGPVPAGTWMFGAGLAVCTLAHFAGRGVYGRRADRWGSLDLTREVLTAHAAGVSVTLAAAALLAPDPQTTTTLVTAGALGTLYVGLTRWGLLLLRHQARIAGRSGQPTLIVGAGWVGAQLERRLLASPGLGLRPVGFLDEDPSPAFRDAGPHGLVLGTPGELASVARRTEARHIIVAFSAARDEEVLPVVRAAQALGIEVSVVPRMFEDVSEHQQILHVGGMAICALRNPNPSAWPFTLKYGLGRLAAATLTLLLAPLMLGLALAVRLSSPGPVLFSQRRVGRDGQVFDILKYRTMRVAASSPAEAGPHLSAVGTGPGGVEGDDRRTRIGTFLRRTSLDELPQLLNVVAGHMALVGPRPERPEFVALFGQEVRGYGGRHRVKSGMTGWAQVNGLRGQTSIAERIELDNWYVANWSVWLDVKILLLTPLEVLRSRAEAATGPSAPAGEAPAPAVAPRGLHDMVSRG